MNFHHFRDLANGIFYASVLVSAFLLTLALASLIIQMVYFRHYITNAIGAVSPSISFMKTLTPLSSLSLIGVPLISVLSFAAVLFAVFTSISLIMSYFYGSTKYGIKVIINPKKNWMTSVDGSRCNSCGSIDASRSNKFIFLFSILGGLCAVASFISVISIYFGVDIASSLAITSSALEAYTVSYTLQFMSANALICFGAALGLAAVVCAIAIAALCIFYTLSCIRQKKESPVFPSTEDLDDTTSLNSKHKSECSIQQ